MYSKYADTYFFTAKINNWQRLLLPDERKGIVLNAIKYLVKIETIQLHAFVIMPNHIHLLITLSQTTNFKQFQLSLLRYTAKMIINEMKKEEVFEELFHYQSTQSDRQFQIWERRPKWIPISNHAIYLQKMDYIHKNPVQERWKLSQTPEEYPWSSAKYYGEIKSDFITYL